MQQPWLTEARSLFFRQNEPEQALKVLQKAQLKRPADHTLRVTTGELHGMVLIQLKQYAKAAQVFKDLKNEYWQGYCYFLLGDLPKAVAAWTPLIQHRENHWCLVLYSMAVSQLNVIPTVIQIRQHLEVDIALLLQASQHVMLNNILAYSDYLIQINMESYKYIGRALFFGGFQEQGLYYLQKSQQIMPTDLEVYYHLAQYYLWKEKPETAKILLQQGLLMAPWHVPTAMLLETI